MPYATPYSTGWSHAQLCQDARTRREFLKNGLGPSNRKHARQALKDLAAEFAARAFLASSQPDQIIGRFGTRTAQRIARAILRRNQETRATKKRRTRAEPALLFTARNRTT